MQEQKQREIRSLTLAFLTGVACGYKGASEALQSGGCPYFSMYMNVIGLPIVMFSNASPVLKFFCSGYGMGSILAVSTVKQAHISAPAGGEEPKQSMFHPK